MLYRRQQGAYTHFYLRFGDMYRLWKKSTDFAARWLCFSFSSIIITKGNWN